jgi:hypothetical protein
MPIFGLQPAGLGFESLPNAVFAIHPKLHISEKAKQGVTNPSWMKKP